MVSLCIYKLVDAFTDLPFGGNPAAVCLLDEERDDKWLQRVAAEFNLSETAYLTRSNCSVKGSRQLDQCKLSPSFPSQMVHSRLGVASNTVEFVTLSGALTAKKIPDISIASENQDRYSIELDFPADPPTEFHSTETSQISAALKSASIVEIKRTSIGDDLLMDGYIVIVYHFGGLLLRNDDGVVEFDINAMCAAALANGNRIHIYFDHCIAVPDIISPAEEDHGMFSPEEESDSYESAEDEAYKPPPPGVEDLSEEYNKEAEDYEARDDEAQDDEAEDPEEQCRPKKKKPARQSNDDSNEDVNEEETNEGIYRRLGGPCSVWVEFYFGSTEGFASALKEVMPRAHHRLRMRHVWKNFMKQWRDKQLKGTCLGVCKMHNHP
ncbi:hypothetical protein K1719_037768 [Acacia pycnantha]|nr:hypothetical protein K1719_037768 [Acacia pycnantha]